jgi:Domain of unknown function (DUF4262)
VQRKQCRCAACAASAYGRKPETWMADVANDIRTAGWSVAAVLGDVVNPPWAYTTGLWATHHVPELAIAGLPVEHMTIILNSIAERVADGLRIEVADEIDGICPCSLTIRPVHASWRETNIFSISDRYYGYVRPPYLQVVWPDRRGRYPGDRGFQPRYEGRQPMLWLPAEDHPPGPWTRIDQLAA